MRISTSEQLTVWYNRIEKYRNNNPLEWKLYGVTRVELIIDKKSIRRQFLHIYISNIINIELNCLYEILISNSKNNTFLAAKINQLSDNISWDNYTLKKKFDSEDLWLKYVIKFLIQTGIVSKIKNPTEFLMLKAKA